MITDYDKQKKQKETIEKIKNILPYKSIMDGQFWRSWKVKSIFDYEQNYCVYLDIKMK
jgi:hypothetical protein